MQVGLFSGNIQPQSRPSLLVGAAVSLGCRCVPFQGGGRKHEAWNLTERIGHNTDFDN